MGVLADLLANPRSFHQHAEGIPRVIYRQLEGVLDSLGDPAYPASCSAINEVQSIAQYTGTATGGNFTLTITKTDGTQVTTGNIAYGASAANINTALSTAGIGDVVATGGNLNTAPVVLTFSGTSVAGTKPGLTVITGVSLVGGTVGAVTVSTNGQTKRTGWAALIVLGVISSAPPVQGQAPGSITVETFAGAFAHQLDDDTIRAVIKEASFGDKVDAVATALLAAIGL